MGNISCQPWDQLQSQSNEPGFPWEEGLLASKRSFQQMYLKKWTEWLKEWIISNTEMCWLNPPPGTITDITQLPAPADIALALESPLTQGPMLLGGTLTQWRIKACFIPWATTVMGTEAIRWAWPFPVPNPASSPDPSWDPHQNPGHWRLSPGSLPREPGMWQGCSWPQYNLTRADWYNKCKSPSAVS